MKNDLRTAAIGALGAIVVMILMGVAPLKIRADGVVFPDGSVLTSADTRRSFYLTSFTADGAAAPASCTSGYHMASLWEILDVSNLRYATEIGDALTQADSGSGPPTGFEAAGWIRTGYGSSPGIVFPVGETNCEAYTKTAATGSVVELIDLWDANVDTDWFGPLAPWRPRTASCSDSVNYRVWCVQD